MDFMIRIFLLAGAWMCQARIISSPRQARLSLAETKQNYFYSNIDGNPGTYSFGYDVQEPTNGNNQFRTEERYPNGTVVGSYGYIHGNGRLYRYKYIADERGYRVSRIRDNIPPQVQYSQWAQPTQGFRDPSPPEVTWSRKKNSSKQKNRVQGIRPLTQSDYKQNNVIQRPLLYYS